MQSENNISGLRDVFGGFVMVITKNTYLQQEDNITILLCNDTPVIIDTDCVSLVNCYQWSIGNHGYVTSGAGKNQVLMHRLITAPPTGMVVDHINHNPRDNRKCNLRICTQHQNNCNRSYEITSKAMLKGVCFAKGKWQAQINNYGKPIYLGRYDSYMEAASAYDSAAYLLFGEYAWLNFPDRPIQYDIFEKVARLKHCKKMTSEDLAEVIRLRQSGKNSKEIARIMGKSYSAILRFLSGRTFKEYSGERNKSRREGK